MLQGVYYNIADYTKDSTWNIYADAAVKAYRDLYVLPNNGGVPGYWNFTSGMVKHYQRTGSVQSRDAVIKLSQNAAYAADYTPLAWVQDSDSSAEKWHMP